MTEHAPHIPLAFDRLADDGMQARAAAFYAEMNRRRTVRDFAPDPIPDGVLENAIRTAGTAPSGAHMQPWHFVLVQDATTKRRIREAAEVEERELYSHRASDEWLEALAPLGTDANKPFLETAPALIAVFLKKFSVDADGRKRKNYYTSESVGIATGLLVAALHQSGLATLTHTPSPMKFLNSVLGRPDHERPFVLLVCGYPAKQARVPALERLPLDAIMTRA
ncbi:MAG: nitroreductase family protein [Pseudomonadota bacterium]